MRDRDYLFFYLGFTILGLGLGFQILELFCDLFGLFLVRDVLFF